MKPIKQFKTKLSLTAAYVLFVLLMHRLQISCLFLRLTGTPCPGCGMTRAWLQVLRLDLAGAFALHGMFWSVPILYWYILYDGKPFSRRWLNVAPPVVIALGFVLNWLIPLI